MTEEVTSKGKWEFLGQFLFETKEEILHLCRQFYHPGEVVGRKMTYLGSERGVSVKVTCFGFFRVEGDLTVITLKTHITSCLDLFTVASNFRVRKFLLSSSS